MSAYLAITLSSELWTKLEKTQPGDVWGQSFVLRNLMILWCVGFLSSRILGWDRGHYHVGQRLERRLRNFLAIIASRIQMVMVALGVSVFSTIWTLCVEEMTSLQGVR